MLDLDSIATELVRRRYGSELGIMQAVKLKAGVMQDLRDVLKGVSAEREPDVLAAFEARFLGR
jgi:hypothetical protein